MISTVRPVPVPPAVATFTSSTYPPLPGVTAPNTCGIFRSLAVTTVTVALLVGEVPPRLVPGSVIVSLAT